jgi:hypothetical protein
MQDNAKSRMSFVVILMAMADDVAVDAFHLPIISLEI